MPNIRSAKKKLRKDIKKTKLNDALRANITKTVKNISKMKGTTKKEKDSLKKAYSIIDKAAKKKIIHANRASRLKARVSRLLKSK